MQIGNNLPKLIFAGLDSAGKTTVNKYAVKELDLGESLNPRATRGIERQVDTFLDNQISIWDLGGQKSYRERYLRKPEVFNGTKAVIFVVDIQDSERIEESYSYFVDIMRILINVTPMPKVYILFHKYDPAEASKLRKGFFKATKLFREADEITGVKFIGFATSIYSDSIQRAVKRILWETSGEKVESKLKPKITEKPKTKVPEKPKVKIRKKRGAKKVLNLPDENLTNIQKPLVEKIDKEEIEENLIYEEVPDLSDLSNEMLDKLSIVVEKRMYESKEILAIAILSINGDIVIQIAKSEIGKENIEIVRDVVKSMNPVEFFKRLKDIEYKGLGNIKIKDFTIYFAKLNDENAIAILADDVSHMMLDNAQKIVKTIRQGIRMVDLSLRDKDKKSNLSSNDSLFSDLKDRISNITSLAQI